MIRKPKVHFGISTVGIKFKERWNIVEMATESEFKEYIRLDKDCNSHVKDLAGNWDWDLQNKRENERVKQRYIRKTWRVRYGNQFTKENLYCISKKIHRYDAKVSPRGGNGVMGLWTIRNSASKRMKGFSVGDIIMYSHTDELGMHYFTAVDQVDCVHMYVFKPDDHQLCAIVLLEET